MDLSEAKGRGLRNERPWRVGRGTGSGNGYTCGRGSKGAKARSGYSHRPGFEGGQMPLFRRSAKRGFSNALFRKVYTIVNVGALAAFEVGARIDLGSILDQGLCSRESDLLKVLGNGEVTKAFTVVAHKFSRSAREKIEKAGGTVEVIGS